MVHLLVRLFCIKSVHMHTNKTPLYVVISKIYACTGCPKSKVTILIFNNFLMKEVVSMKFSWY